MIDLLKIDLYPPHGVRKTILPGSFQVDHFFGRVALFSRTTGSILLDSWLYWTGIYTPNSHDWAHYAFASQVLSIAALLVGPVPPVRLKEYLEKLDDARQLVMEFLQNYLNDTKKAKLHVESP
jgi:hypothetical protein